MRLGTLESSYNLIKSVILKYYKFISKKEVIKGGLNKINLNFTKRLQNDPRF